MRTIATLGVLLVLSLPGYASDDTCGARCAPIQSQVPDKIAGPWTCLHFRQTSPGQVKVFIYQGETETYRHAKDADTDGKFCIGPQRLSGATKVVLCQDGDDGHSAELAETEIANIVKKGSMPKGSFLCLLGKEACDALPHFGEEQIP
jgi:hypothetical protein